MAKCAECPEAGLPEWIMSYADMITILMAFFVVMYSMAGSQKDNAREEAVLKSLRDQFGPNWNKLSAMGPGPYVPFASKGGGNASKPMGKGEARESHGDHARVHTLRPGEQTVVGGAVYFADGESALTAAQRKQLEITASEVSGKPQRIEIRGHTSRGPLPKNSPYRDNWDLAYARCRTAMEELVKSGVDPERIRLGVAADNEPKTNTADGMIASQAARVEVFLLSELASQDRTRAKGSAPGASMKPFAIPAPEPAQTTNDPKN